MHFHSLKLCLGVGVKNRRVGYSGESPRPLWCKNAFSDPWPVNKNPARKLKWVTRPCSTWSRSVSSSCLLGLALTGRIVVTELQPNCCKRYSKIKRGASTRTCSATVDTVWYTGKHPLARPQMPPGRSGNSPIPDWGASEGTWHHGPYE